MPIFWRALADLLVCVRNRRWDYIGAACPFAQIDSAAAVAAKGEFGVAALYDFLTDRAAELKNALAWHDQGDPGFGQSGFRVCQVPAHISNYRIQNKGLG